MGDQKLKEGLAYTMLAGISAANLLLLIILAVDGMVVIVERSTVIIAIEIIFFSTILAFALISVVQLLKRV